MQAIHNPLKPPNKQFVLPEDFGGFHPERIKQLREMRKNQTVKMTMCFLRDNEQLKGALKYRLKKMGFAAKINKSGYDTYTHLSKLTSIQANTIFNYFNHNRLIWNESKGKSMQSISEANLLILCLFAGVKLSLNIEFEPLELIR